MEIRKSISNIIDNNLLKISLEEVMEGGDRIEKIGDD